MKYEVRRPIEADRSNLDRLLIEDYKKSDITKPPLSDRQVAHYSHRAWAAFNEQGRPEAIALTGQWNYRTAAPYSRLPEISLRLLAKAGLYRGETGVYVMSAENYDDDGPLAAIDDEKGFLTPETGKIHVPLLKTEEAARDFLLGRGFTQGRDGIDHITWLPSDDTVETTLFTRK